MTERIVAIDLGGTKTSAALVDREGQLGPVLTRPTPAQDGPDAILSRVEEVVREIGASAELAGVGIGAAGVIDADTGRVISSTDAIRDWAGTPVAEHLSERLGVPVVVANDADAHATGEAWRGAGAGHSSMLMVAVGTGVGAGLVLERTPLRGAHHLGGEIGHMPTPGAAHLRCACGRAGHLEAIASGPGLLRHYRSLGGDDQLVDARAVVAATDRADPVAARAVVDAARALGQCVAGIVTVLDPEIVVIGGGLAEAGARWWDTVEATFRAEVIDLLADLPLRPAALGPAAAMMGAAHHIWSTIDATKEQP